MKWSFDQGVSPTKAGHLRRCGLLRQGGLEGCLPSEGILSRNARLATCALGLDAAFWFDAFHQRTLE